MSINIRLQGQSFTVFRAKTRVNTNLSAAILTSDTEKLSINPRFS